jgi:NAD(P)-dependent dehydrogenase (short-subunit alcohol dehydrogenase family)
VANRHHRRQPGIAEPPPWPPRPPARRISYRQIGAADDVVRQVRSLGRRGLAVAADSADEGAVVRLFAEVDRQLGTIDALVNNAGIVGGSGRVENMTAEEVSRVLAVNVVGCFTAAREAVKRMSTRHGGRGGAIVNISSAAARLGSPGEFVHYAASKGASHARSAREVADEASRERRTRHTDTEIPPAARRARRRIIPTVPMKRIGTPEVAQTSLWLLSRRASYVTPARSSI